MEARVRQLSFMEESKTADGSATDVENGSGGGAAAPYLEYNRNTVEKTPQKLIDSVEYDRVTVDHVLIGCKCKCRFCPTCAESQGIKLRMRTIKAVEHWEAVQMWTLTIDPELFKDQNDKPDPEAAYRYVCDKRCVSEWVRKLKYHGHLIDNSYFYAVEFQKNGMPHWHIMLHSKFIPFKEAARFWNMSRPKTAGPVQGDRPGFGSICFTDQKWRSTNHAVNYVTKYIIKEPEEGWPDWVLDYEGRIDRYSTSRLFWQSVRTRDCQLPDKPEVKETECTDDEYCDCPECRGDEKRPRKCTRTVRERIKSCRSKCTVMLRREREYRGVVYRDYAYAFMIEESYKSVAQDLTFFMGGNETVLEAHEVRQLREDWGPDEPLEYDVFDPSPLWEYEGRYTVDQLKEGVL